MPHDEKRKQGALERRGAAPRELEELREAMVPLAYAEKTMSSLLRLHEELVEEKERRIDLYRRLMDREQQLAELKAYVRLLEAEKERSAEAPPAQAVRAREEKGGGSPAREAAAIGEHPSERRAAAEARPAAEPRPAVEAKRVRPVQHAPEAAASGPSHAPILVWAPGNLPQRDEEGGGGIASPGEGDGRTE